MSYYHDPSHSLPYYLSPVGHHIREVFCKENRCYNCHNLGHQHSKCPTCTRAPTPKVNLLETDLTAGDASSAYLTLAQTVPPADDDSCDATYALFHPLLSISVPVSADSHLSAPSPKFLLDMGASTTFVDPKLAARLGWEVRKGLIWMRVHLAGGLAGPLVTDMVVRSFSLGGRMYQVNGVLMDLHGTYDASSEAPSHYEALPTYKLNLPTLLPTKDPLVIQNHLDKLAIQFKGLANGCKYDPVLLERHKIYLAAQTLSAPEHIAYAKTAKNQLTFQEWAAGFKEAVLPYGWITTAERNMAALALLAQDLTTIPCFVDKVRSYIALLEDVDSALPDAFVAAFIRQNMHPAVCADMERDHTEKDILPNRSNPTRPAVTAITDTPSSTVDFAKWYDAATRLLKGLLGRQVCQHLTEKGRCWLCRKVGHKSPECPKCNDPATVNTVKTHEGDQYTHETEEAAGLAEVLALNITESVSPLFIKCQFHFDGPHFHALFNTGASISLIDPSLVDMNQLQVMTALRSWQVALAGGIAGPRLCQMVEEDIWIGDAKYKCAAFVMPLGKQYQVILSLNFILTHGFLTGTTILEQVVLHTTHPFMVSSLATDPH
ncbi:hypothetical protein J001_01190 [Cryptococcus neoformans]|nr:hypothetical protein J001_01190 [Cryptococcus neoformans var. grubii]